jgi:hypothetical protein
MAEKTERHRFSFTWYHREEWQVIAVLLSLVVFFSRGIWISLGLTAFVLAIIFLLYIARMLETAFSNRGIFPGIVQQYRDMKNVLHVHSVERSRITMALLASAIVSVLCIHRIGLASMDPVDAAPTDIYWIMFLGWYAVVCTTTTAYLLWLWRNWVRHQSVRIPLMDGLVSSLFFFHGITKRERIITYIATFILGGVPSFFALRLTTETPYGYTIACLLIIPVILLTLGGAYYAKLYLTLARDNNSSENPG